MPKKESLTILQLSKKFPYPLKDGESIAIHSLAEALVHAGATVDLLAMNTLRHPYLGEAKPRSFDHYRHVDTVVVDNRIKPLPAFLNLFSEASYHIERFVSASFSAKLAGILQDNPYDLIQLETIYLAPYIPVIRKHSKAKICLRTHNLEHEIWQRMVENTPPGPKRWYLKHLTHKLARYEKQSLAKVDLLAAITSRDLAAFRQLGYLGEGLVCPIGLDLSKYKRPLEARNGHLSISFIGSLDWMPNIEGLKWFLQEIWPSLNKDWPSLRLHLAGRNTPEWLLQLNIPGGIVHGEVPDAADFIQAHPIMVVPLRSGSGMRAKILEGMAMGKVVITTRLGLEGIEAEPGREVLVADDPETFRRHIDFLHKQPDQLQIIGDRAKRLVARAYNSHDLGERLHRAYQEVTENAMF